MKEVCYVLIKQVSGLMDSWYLVFIGQESKKTVKLKRNQSHIFNFFLFCFIYIFPVCVYACMHACECVHLCASVHASVNVCMCVYLYTHRGWHKAASLGSSQLTFSRGSLLIPEHRYTDLDNLTGQRDNEIICLCLVGCGMKDIPSGSWTFLGLSPAQQR